MCMCWGDKGGVVKVMRFNMVNSKGVRNGEEVVRKYGVKFRCK